MVSLLWHAARHNRGFVIFITQYNRIVVLTGTKREPRRYDLSFAAGRHLVLCRWFDVAKQGQGWTRHLSELDRRFAANPPVYEATA